MLIAASRKEKVEDRVAVAEAAGLKPRVMDVESYATQEAFELIAPSLPASGRDQNIALVDIGAHVTHFYVLRNNQFLFSRDQAFGGNQLTHDIQRAFNLSPDEAESAKKNQGLPENYDADVLQPFMETLALEVTRALQFFFTSTSYSQVDQIDPGRRLRAAAGARRTRRQAGRGRDLDRQSLRQHDRVRAHPAAATGAGRAAADGRLRAGAAELRMSAGAVRINLLPHREQKRAARQRQFISLAISLRDPRSRGHRPRAHGHWRRRSTSQQSRNALLKSEIAKLDEQIREIDKLREQTQALLARKQVVETLQTNRTEAVHLLDQLVRQLPDGIYLRSREAAGHAGHADRVRAIQCPRVDADAQHREFALAGRAGAGGDQVGAGARFDGGTRRRAAHQRVHAQSAAQARRAAPRTVATAPGKAGSPAPAPGKAGSPSPAPAAAKGGKA